MLKVLSKDQIKAQDVKLGVTKPKVYLKPDSDMNKVINAYLNSQTGKFGQYFALPNALVHRRVLNNYQAGTSEVCQSVVAMDLKGFKIGNSSVLPMLGATINFGNLRQNRQITEVQTKISQFITMIPFTVFDEAQLDIRKLNVVQKLSEETHEIKVRNPDYESYDKETMKKKGIKEFLLEQRHFTGACLFEVEGRIFLFDIDREEIRHKIFNPFLAEIPAQVTTVSQAYEALKPKEVLEAETKGLKVVRQGEWFFIPTDHKGEPDTEISVWGEDKGKKVDKPLELRAGNNRPNTASQGIETLGLVRGKVEHSGREHRTVLLKTWHKAVPNTSIQSFTLTGNID